jgi:hypothetical protein
MRIFENKMYKWIASALGGMCMAAGALLLLGGQDQQRPPPSQSPPAQQFGGMDALLPKNHELSKLEIAARDGDLGAKLMLARAYARGDGVEKNEARAFAYFEAIANQFPDIDPLEPRAQYVSEAFRELSAYYKSGIPSIGLKPDDARALSLLQHAAGYFGDPISQYKLAKMFMAGEEVERNVRIAFGWLLNASRKGYAPAQAMLGDMLWRGESVKRAAGDGLGLLAVARSNASGSDVSWISGLFKAARSKATPEDLASAENFILQNGPFLQVPFARRKIAGPDELLAPGRLEPKAKDEPEMSLSLDGGGADAIPPSASAGLQAGSRRGPGNQPERSASANHGSPRAIARPVSASPDPLDRLAASVTDDAGATKVAARQRAADRDGEITGSAGESAPQPAD